MSREWQIDAAVCCGMGRKRKNNEDSFYLNGYSRKLSEMDLETSQSTLTDGNGSLWSVCDGMGGANNGELASYTAVSGMKDLQQHLKGRNFALTAQSWVRQADQVISNRVQDGGCTMTMLYGQEKWICYAHIGDSRIYRIHNGHLMRLTRDHSKVEMLMAAGLITAEEAAVHPERHVITRSLGMNREMVPEATIGNPQPIMNGDKYLLCSDGISDMLRDEEIERIAVAECPAMDCAISIYQAALNAGGLDNLTIMVLNVMKDSDLPEDDDEELDEPTIDSEDEIEPTQTIDVDIQHSGKEMDPCSIRIEQKVDSDHRCIMVQVS